MSVLVMLNWRLGDGRDVTRDALALLVQAREEGMVVTGLSHERGCPSGPRRIGERRRSQFAGNVPAISPQSYSI